MGRRRAQVAFGVLVGLTVAIFLTTVIRARIDDELESLRFTDLDLQRISSICEERAGKRDVSYDYGQCESRLRARFQPGYLPQD